MESLAAKLTALDPSGDETAAFGALISAAEQPDGEIAGFDAKHDADLAGRIARALASGGVSGLNFGSGR